MRPIVAWRMPNSVTTQVRHTTERKGASQGAPLSLQLLSCCALSSRWPLFFWEEIAQPSIARLVAHTRTNHQATFVSLFATAVRRRGLSRKKPRDCTLKLEAEYQERYQTYKDIAEAE